MGNYTGLSRWTQYNQKCLHKREVERDLTVEKECQSNVVRDLSSRLTLELAEGTTSQEMP